MLPEHALVADYAGHGLANVATSSMAPFGTLPGSLPPLAEDVLPAALLEGVERVVVVVLDGLGWDQMRAHVEAEPDSGFATLVRAHGAAAADRATGAREGREPSVGHVASVTSVTPSTTAAALATLSTGVSPLAHGVLGYRMFMPALGVTVNSIRMQAVFGTRSLLDLGVDPSVLLPQPTVYERLAEIGVAAECITRAPFTRSPLSRLIYRGSEPLGYLGPGDMFALLRKRLEANRERKAFFRVYYDHVDGVAHAYGPESPEHAAETALLGYTLQHELLDRVRDPQTLLVVTSDHGHVPIRPENVVSLNEHPGLVQELTFPPTGEGRMPFLHVRDGRRDAARRYVEEHLGHAATVVDQEKLVSAGLYGPPEHAHPEALARLGDLAMLVRDGHRFVYDLTPTHGPPPLAGHHGGLMEPEMRVPLLAARLG